MDKTDIVLSQLLLMNSRLPYSELAENLGLSVNAVHKRVKAMIDANIIRAFRARIGLSALGGVPAFIFGRSEARPIDDVPQRLRADDSTFWVGLAGGNNLYVGGYLHAISHLVRYVSFVKKEAQISEPTVGIETAPVPTGKLSTLDYQIIRSLHRNSRRPVSEVAEELGASVKTVQRHLTRMIREGLVEMAIEWYPDTSNDILTMLHVQLKSQAEQTKVGPSLMQRYSPNLVYFFSFSNLPNLLLFWGWTNTMKELKDLLERLRGEEKVASVEPNILYTGYIFDTWRDKLLMERGAPNPRNAA